MAKIIRRGKASSYHGRFHLVRLHGAQGVSPPYVLDRQRGTLGPCDPYFWVYDDGEMFPAVGGAAGMRGSLQHPRFKLGLDLTFSLITTALSSAYVYGSAGAAVASRLVLAEAKTVSALYFYLNAKTGTIPGNDLNYEIRNASGDDPGATIQTGGSGTIDITSITAPSWISVTGLSVSLAALTDYWVVIADASAVDASNMATVGRHSTTSPLHDEHSNNPYVTTTNGFSTVTRNNVVQLSVVVFSDNTAVGLPWVLATATASDTNRRGLYVSAGFTETLKWFGLVNPQPLTNGSGLELYDASATVPGTGALSIGATAVLKTGTNLVGYMVAPYTLAKATGYRFVYTYSGVSTIPGYFDVGTGGDTTMYQAALGGGAWYLTRANGTTDWSNDVTTAYPRVILLMEDQVAVAGGGGGGPLIGPGRLVR